MQTLHSGITTIVSRFDAVDRRMEILDHRMDALDRRYQTLETRQEAIDTSNTVVLQRFDQLTGLVTELQTMQGQILTQVSSIEQSVTYSRRRRIDPSPVAPSSSTAPPPPPPTS